jgi:tartrate dehydrogenase/decarboxylase/D-malate dehydrogenase
VKTYQIATIPGDGIGKEVVPAGREVLESLANASSDYRFEFENSIGAATTTASTEP